MRYFLFYFNWQYYNINTVGTGMISIKRDVFPKWNELQANIREELKQEKSGIKNITLTGFNELTK